MKHGPADEAVHRSPLLRPGWQHVEKVALETFTVADWELLNRQRSAYYADEQARQVLRMLSATRDDASFGYLVNNYRHCLQSATMAMRDGLGEEDVVVSLLHDIGFIACPDLHGEFAAALLGAYVSDRNVWMLRHHAAFQNAHCTAAPAIERDARERWRGHPHFEWTAAFVAKYDQAATDPCFDCAPIEFFEPMVRRIFARAPQPRPPLQEGR
jgi:predicted HD phosphohydrolase